MKKIEEEKQAGPSALPVVLYEGRQYFADLRLKEFRSVSSFESIPFYSEQGTIICKNNGIVTCKSCGMSVIISKADEEKELRCMQCFSRDLLPLCDK